MCSRQLPRHPICHHAAHGTALESARLVRCEESEHHRAPCPTVPWSYYDVLRGYCDTCILNGEKLAQQQGLDRGLYCQRLGVSYSALREANPGAFR